MQSRPERTPTNISDKRITRRTFALTVATIVSSIVLPYWQISLLVTLFSVMFLVTFRSQLDGFPASKRAIRFQIILIVIAWLVFGLFYRAM